ncbi:MAG: C-terminal helicase domain-containing protein [Bacteroidales bacterium]|nr:C-terminal helicase domain-containing protein [Bacteroidales bacterium]
MGEHQQKVYEAFRQNYKEKLLKKIDEEMNKARFNVLDGILKLRQICDSPALLNTKEYYGDDSAKADELIRYILEKTSHHKVLVFSQFVKMLTLIKNRLEKHNIVYTSLDGSTRDREERVNYFQNNEECRVFLISLKAGGYGLNLTGSRLRLFNRPLVEPGRGEPGHRPHPPHRAG